MEKELQKLEHFIPYFNTIDLSKSNVSVGWHLWHSIKVIHSICNALEKSNPEEYVSSFSIYKSFFLTVGWFPRGKGKAPKIVRYPDHISTQQLEIDLAAVKEKMIKLDQLSPNAFFTHPYFKSVNLKSAKRFLLVHTQHHLKIVEDILKQ